MTTIYLMRHSEPFKNHKGIEDIRENLLFSNIKSPLSIQGEKLAEKISNNSEFDNLDDVWSSDYVRAMSTAKYFAAKNNLKVNISDKFGERKHGVNSWDELPENFELHQFQDDKYKIGDGESQQETKERMKNALDKILNTNKNKITLIVGHATSIAFLLTYWCEINYTGPYKFNNKDFYNGEWDYCETFKLIFDDKNNLISIENLKFDK